MNEMKTDCCPRFDPEPWDEKLLTWVNKSFVTDRVRSFFHIPLNFGSLMKRNMTLIEESGAKPEVQIVITDENSLWGSDVYIGVTKDVPGARMASLSGTFMSKVFEGSYGQVRRWCDEMHEHVEAQGKEVKKMYFYYTTCPKCAKVYGKNYIVLLAQVA